MNFTRFLSLLVLCCNYLLLNGQQNDVFQDSIIKSKDGFDFNAFIPEGYEILLSEKGDLNLDNKDDVILVLNKRGEDSLSTDENPIKRKFLILLRETDETFILRYENDNIAPFYGYDLNFRDALAGLAIKAGEFTVDQYGGTTTRWTRTTTFRYNPSDQQFYLFQDVEGFFDATDENDEGSERIYTEKDFGKVLFTDFDMYKELR